jgi:hypothetical protein
METCTLISLFDDGKRILLCDYRPRPGRRVPFATSSGLGGLMTPGLGADTFARRPITTLMTTALTSPILSHAVNQGIEEIAERIETIGAHFSTSPEFHGILHTWNIRETDMRTIWVAINVLGDSQGFTPTILDHATARSLPRNRLIPEQDEALADLLCLLSQRSHATP